MVSMTNIASSIIARRLLKRLRANTTITPKAALSVLTTALVAGLLVTAYSYRQTYVANHLISHPDEIIEGQQADADVLFARAHQLSMQNQQQQTAINLYNQAANQARLGEQPELWQACKYNMGLLYLQQAITAQQSDQPKVHQQFRPLAELAQTEFRAVLTANPTHYDARLSMAQTLSLLPEDNNTTAGWKENRSSVFSHVAGVNGGGP